MKKNVYAGYAILLMILFGLSGLTGCGQKGPPVAPVKINNAIAAPYDVQLKNIGNDIHLTWKHEINEKTAAVKPEVFEIFIAKKRYDECEGCPFTFTLAGKVDASVKEFFVPVRPGFKYYFRIQATDDDRLKSPYSNTIELDYK